MSFPADFLPTHERHTVTVVEPVVIVERGEEVEDWSDQILTELAGCIAYPGSVDADWERAQALGIDFTVLVPSSYVLPSGNFRVRIEHESGDFILKGDIKRWVYGQRFDAFALELERRRDGV